jgi:hypothetical protein
MEFYAPGLDTVTGSEEGRPMKVILPGGGTLKRKDSSDVEITLYGSDSHRHRDAYRILTRAVAKGQSENENYDSTDDRLAYLAAMTSRWNVQLADGKDAPCTGEAVKAFFRMFPSAADQADVFISRRANFTPAPSDS